MAITLKFMGEDGRVQRFRWSDYPMVVTRIDPNFVRAEWRPTAVLPPTMSKWFQSYVHCGPAAPLPAEPTAETFRAGVELWLYR